MKNRNILLILLGIIVIIIVNNSRMDYIKSITPLQISFPKRVHLIYIPWDETGKLKPDETDFSHDFYYRFKRENKGWDVKLWGLSELKSFISEYYPKYFSIWRLIKHPMQAVDFLRLLVTYHFGGIYYQYDSVQKAALDKFVPPVNKVGRLFVEKIISELYSKKMANERLRRGKPEELLRVANQVFSAYPKNEFLLYCINKSWNNLNNMTVRSQYDILYVGANAMFSEAYHEYPYKDTLELTYDIQNYVEFSSKGSWRLSSY